MNKVTQTELDWFVEGELDHQQRSELFARLDADADGWKRCALALLERDALRVAFADFNSNLSAIPETELKESSKQNVHSAETSLATRSHRVSLPWGYMAVAAVVSTLLMGLTQFWLASDQLPVAELERPLVQTQNQSSKAPVSQNRQTAHPSEYVAAINQVINEAGVADSRILALVSMKLDDEKFILPLIESETLSKQLVDLDPLVVPSELTRELTRSGFKVQPKRQFVSLNHKDGTNEVVPMNMLNCNFVGRSVF